MDSDLQLTSVFKQNVCVCKSIFLIVVATWLWVEQILFPLFFWLNSPGLYNCFQKNGLSSFYENRQNYTMLCNIQWFFLGESYEFKFGGKFNLWCMSGLRLFKIIKPFNLGISNFLPFHFALLRVRSDALAINQHWQL